MIEAEHLVKDYGAIKAVDDVSFHVRKGDILGFLGPNGAGKSTTMKMLTGFLSPNSGVARVGGFDVQKDPIAAKKLFGYLPENGPLYHEMTVSEFLRFIAEMRGISARPDRIEKIGRVGEICHLDEVLNQTIDTLSKGYRQRVGMAQAVLHDPSCLIMDEPTEGLDPNQKKEVRKLIGSMSEEKAIILSTHILDEAEAMCNRIIIIARGKIIVDEKPEDLRRRHPRYNAVSLKLRGVETDSVIEILSRLEPVEKVWQEDGRLIVVPEKNKTVDELVLQTARDNNWPISAMEKPSVPLDEVFWSLTQDN